MIDSEERFAARRFFIGGMVQRAAAKHQVYGFVKNLPDGRVEVFAQGSESALRKFKEDLAAGPRFARVHEIEEIVVDPDPKFADFRVER